MEIIKDFQTNKGKYAVIKEGNRIIFRKYLNCDILDEINGYKMIKKLYNVPELISYDFKNRIIDYEYKEALEKDILHIWLFMERDFSIEKIVKILTNPLKKYKIMNENLSKNSKFFIGRIPNVIEYLNSNNYAFDKKLICNGYKCYSFKECVKSIIYDITRNQMVPCAILQGDPTDLNIAVNGMITDFEVSGENSIVNEIAIFLGCFIVNCYYFYIKYMNSPHKKYIKTMEKYDEIVKCDFTETETDINILFKNIIPKKDKELILAYISEVEKIDLINNNYNLGSYVAMRMISPVNIMNIADMSDRNLLMALASLFTYKYRSLDEIKTFITEV